MEPSPDALACPSELYKGVFWNGATQQWFVSINVAIYGVPARQFLGSFDTEEAAARKYDIAAAFLGMPLNLPAGAEPGVADVVRKAYAASFVGRSVRLDFYLHGSVAGTVSAFDADSGLWEVTYDDGDREEMKTAELERIMSPETSADKDDRGDDDGDDADHDDGDNDYDDDGRSEEDNVECFVETAVITGRQPHSTASEVSSEQASKKFSSRFTGVSWAKRDQKWKVQIRTGAEPAACYQEMRLV
jgi:hypothetical protein